MQRTTQNEYDDLAAPLSLDLVAAFSLAEESVARIVSKAADEGWDSERLISEIELLFSEEGYAEPESE
jgi:hypothetical protein